MQTPFWSVVVPVFERTKFIAKCLDSIIYQIGDNCEIIITENPSGTSVTEFVRSLFGDNSRFRFLVNDENLGIFGNMNAGIRASRGKWIHVLHDDDWVLPAFYGTVRNAIQGPAYGCGVVATGWSVVQHDGRVEPYDAHPGEIKGVMGMGFWHGQATQNFVAISSVCYSRETYDAVGPFREDLPHVADWEWYMRGFGKIDWYRVDCDLARWHRHAESATDHYIATGEIVDDYVRLADILDERLPLSFRPYLAELRIRQARACARWASDALYEEPLRMSRLLFVQANLTAATTMLKPLTRVN